MQVKSRHHLRSDEVAAIRDTVAEALDVDLDGDTFELVELEDADVDLVLVDGQPLVFYVDEEPFLTVRGRKRSSQAPAASPATRARFRSSQ